MLVTTRSRNALMMDIIHITALAKSPPPVIGSAADFFETTRGSSINMFNFDRCLSVLCLYPENYKAERSIGDAQFDNPFNPVISGLTWKLVPVGEKEPITYKKVGKIARIIRPWS